MQDEAFSIEEAEHIAALERWLVREVVERLLEPFLVNTELMEKSSFEGRDGQTFVRQLFRFLLDFPSFRGQPRVERAVTDVFATLPRIHASLLTRGRSNNKGLKTLLGPMFSGPILSAARASRTEAKSRQVRKSVECAAILLCELHEEVNGLTNFLEELKCAHSVNELRPSTFMWVTAVRQEFIDYLTLISTDSVLRARLGRLFAIVPRKTLMLILKTNTTNGALAASIRLLFARPFGGRSVLQKLVADSLGYHNTCGDIANYEDQLQKQSQRLGIIQQFGVEEQELAVDNRDENNALERKVALESYLVLEAGGTDRFANDQEVLRAIRYLDLLKRKRSTDDLLDALGDERFVDALCNLALCTHEVLAQTLFAKGSGLVKFAEDVFACIDAVLEPSGKPPHEVNHKSISKLVDDILNRTLALIHNVLLADKNMLLHESAHWYFDIYKNAARMPLPTEILIRKIQTDGSKPADVKAIMAEAQKVFQRECANRTPGIVWQPRPRLSATERLLLPLFTLAVRDHLIPPPSHRGSSCNTTTGFQSLTATKKDGLINVEVVLLHAESEIWSNLSARKFVLCGRMRSSSLWVRHVSDATVAGQLCNPSIVEIAFTNNEQHCPVGRATSGHWIVVPKNINKYSLFAEKLFLWFRRARDKEEEAERILGLEILPCDVDVRKKRAMESIGYRVVMTIDTGVMHQSQVWMLGGLNKTELSC